MADDELTTPPHVDEGTMHAWLDGALSSDEAGSVELHVASCAQCNAAAAEARGLIAASTRILSALDNVPANVVPVAKDSRFAATLPPRRGWSARTYGPIAAVALIAVGAMLFLRRAPTLVPTSAPEGVVAMPVVRPVEKSNQPVASAPSVPPAAVTSAKSEAAVHTAPTPLAAAAIKERRAAPATTTASAAASANRSAELLRIEAAKPEARQMTVPATIAPSAVITGATSSQSDASSPNASRELGKAAGGATAAPTMAGARVVSTDEFDVGSSHVRRTVFALDSSRTVTFTERKTSPVIAALAAESAATTARSPSLLLRGPSLQGVQSVMWTLSDGTLLTLSGPLSVSELEALKPRIVP